MFFNNTLSNNILANARVTFHSTTKTESNASVVANKSQQTSNKTILGYGVDDNGYFTNDFNKAAGIPEHIKIHSSTMESLYRANVETPTHPWAKAYSDIDIAKTIGNAYKVLSQLVDGQTLNKTSFSKDELTNLPQGYEFDRSTLEVSRVHRSILDFDRANESFDYKNKNNQIISSTFYNPIDWSSNNPKREPATKIFDNRNGGKESTDAGHFWDTGADKYTNSDGSISMGGILVGMLNGNLYLKEGKATYWGQLEGFDRNVDPEAIQAEYYASWGRSVFDYSDQELSMMSEEKREYIEGMRKEQIKIWVVNGYGIPDHAREAYNEYMNDEDFLKFIDPFEEVFKNIDKANKERLERLRKEAIETRQKAQEEAKKPNHDDKDVNQLYEESNQAIQEFAKLIEKLQEESNKTKDPKDQWNVSADSIQKAFLNLLNEQNKQTYNSNTQQPTTTTFEVKA